MKILLTDIDGVLVNWDEGFMQWLSEEKGYTIVDPKESHDIHVRLGVPIGVGSDLIKEFHTKEAFSKLRAFPDAVEYLNKFYEEGWIIRAISAANNTPYTQRAREANLKTEFGDIFSSVELTGLHQSKKDALVNYPKGSVWVDDLPRHTVSGVECGHRSFLRSWPHNEQFEHPEVIRISDWSEIYAHCS
jgi:FMN phosphatase YigB (HAD superfamily)